LSVRKATIVIRSTQEMAARVFGNAKSVPHEIGRHCKNEKHTLVDWRSILRTIEPPPSRSTPPGMTQPSRFKAAQGPGTRRRVVRPTPTIGDGILDFFVRFTTTFGGGS
jgi:hypothetical protein